MSFPDVAGHCATRLPRARLTPSACRSSLCGGRASPAPRFDFSRRRPKRSADAGDSADGDDDPSVPDTTGHLSRPPFPDAYLPEPESLDALKDLRPLGQIHDSFIIAAGRDGLWIIDQHVAHERILFEQVLAARIARRRRRRSACWSRW